MHESWSITSGVTGARNGRLWRARTPMNPLRDLPFVRASRGLQPPVSECSQRKNFSSENTHARQVQGNSKAVCHGSRARPRAAARHGKSSTVPSLKHHAWRPSCRARHNVERDISSELADGARQNLPQHFGHGHFDLGQHFRRSPPLQRTEFTWRTGADA